MNFCQRKTASRSHKFQFANIYAQLKIIERECSVRVTPVTVIGILSVIHFYLLQTLRRSSSFYSKGLNTQNSRAITQKIIRLPGDGCSGTPNDLFGNTFPPLYDVDTIHNITPYRFPYCQFI